MSSRTLQRRIAEEDSSFRQLLSDARRELARVYLQHPSLGLSKTASLLGYENPKLLSPRVPGVGRCNTHRMESDAKGGTPGDTGSAPAVAGQPPICVLDARNLVEYSSYTEIVTRVAVVGKRRDPIFGRIGERSSQVTAIWSKAISAKSYLASALPYWAIRVAVRT
jgi:hypothetical protein